MTVKFLIQLIAIASMTCTLSYANLGEVDDTDLENPMIEKGKAALQQEDWSTAIAAFEQALENLSGSADLQNFLGYAYRKSGDLGKALEHYRMALEINPDHKGALEYLGEAYITLGDLKSAKIQLEQLKHLCSPELTQMGQTLNPGGGECGNRE